MADTRTVVEGDLKNPKKNDPLATKIETASGATLPTFGASTQDGKNERRERGDATQFFRPEDAQSPDRVARKLVGWLYSFALSPAGEYHALYEGRTTIGSGRANDIVINDPNVSAKHCFIVHRNTKKTFVKDEGSTNGTFVNGEELVGSEKLITDGDEIKIAHIPWTVRLVKEAIPAPAAT